MQPPNPVRHARRNLDGFTLIEILAGIMAFSLVFLAGFAGIGHLMVVQNANYARALGGSACMLLSRWHAERPNVGGFIRNVSDPAANGNAGNILIEVTTNVRDSFNGGLLHFRGVDFATNTLDAEDRFFVLNSNAGLVDSVTGAVVDLSNRGQNTFITSEYDGLLLAVSGPSTREVDSKMVFRQLTIWSCAPIPVQGLKNGQRSMSLEMVGRFLMPDTCTP